MPTIEWRRLVVYSAAESGWWLDRVGDHFHQPPTALAVRPALRSEICTQAVSACSSGERKRLVPIRALGPQSPVLLLDEPTGGLDPDSVARVEAVLQERMVAGTIIVLVTHNPAQAGRMSTVRGHLALGRLSLGTPGWTQLALGAGYAEATHPLFRSEIRRGTLPIINQMPLPG